MILWTIKQILSLKTVFTGRAYPHELAWGLALGLAIGLVPKGNLISMLLIGLLVSVRVNHGMAALSAVAFSFLAVRLDPWTHELGVSVLQSPQTRPTLERFWDLPLVPWTELNNTVVMGSTIAGMLAILPTYALTLPIFRSLAPNAKTADLEQNAPSPSVDITDTIADAASLVPDDSAAAEGQMEGAEQFAAEATDTALEHTETQIDIIRLHVADAAESNEDDPGREDSSMNEALGYLLRRLRDSRQGRAA